MYLETQRDNNFMHANGLLEGEGDIAGLVPFITEAQYHDSILEVGCRLGLGPFVIANTYPNKEVVGVDLVGEFIDIARTRARLMDCHNVSYEVWDTHNEPPNELAIEYDLVFSTGVLEHLHTPHIAIPHILSLTSNRFIHYIDLAEGVSHCAHLNKDEWLGLFSDMSVCRHTHVGDRLIIEGVR